LAKIWLCKCRAQPLKSRFVTQSASITSVASHFSLLASHPHHSQVPSISATYPSFAHPFCLLHTHHVSTAKSGSCDIIFPLLQSAGHSVNLTIMSSCLEVTLHLSTLRSVLKARPVYHPRISTLQPSGLTSSTSTKCRHTRHLHRCTKTGAQRHQTAANATRREPSGSDL